MSYTVRLFRDADAPTQVNVNVAEIMAKSGAKTDSENGLVPDIKIETPAPEAPAPAPAKVETTAQPVVAEQPKTEVSKPAEQTPVAPPSWQEVLTNSRPDMSEVLKTLGFDEKMTGFLNTWRSNGDVTAYLKAALTDYSKMNSEEVMRDQLRRDYSDWSDEDLKELYRLKITETYKLDPELFTPEEVKRGQLLLNADAKKVREQLVKDQQSYILNSKAPEPQIPAELVELQQREEQREKDRSTYIEAIKNNPVTQELYKNKSVTVGTGESAFKYEVNPDSIVDLLIDPGKAAARLWNQDGSPNMARQILFGAIMNDDDSFIKLYGNHMMMLGAKKTVEPMENASTPGPTPSNNGTPQDPAAALAKAGMITTG